MAQVYLDNEEGEKERYGNIEYGVFTRHIPSRDVIMMDRSVSLEYSLIHKLRQSDCEILQLIVATGGRRIFFRIGLEEAVELSEERGEHENERFRVRIDTCRTHKVLPIIVEGIKPLEVIVDEPVKMAAQQKLFEVTQRYDHQN